MEVIGRLGFRGNYGHTRVGMCHALQSDDLGNARASIVADGACIHRGLLLLLVEKKEERRSMSALLEDFP